MTGEPASSGTTTRVRVPDEAEGERLDRFLAARLPEVSRSRIQRLVSGGQVTVEGVVVDRSSRPVTGGETIRVELPPEEPPAPEPREMPLVVLHEDDDVVVIDKPPGLVVHPGAGHRQDTLVSALLFRYGDGLSGVGGPERPGIVHRLDKGTSGVIVVARHDEAHRHLARQFAERTVDKRYDALVYGCPDAPEGTIDVSLGRSRRDRTRISPDTDRPRSSLTRWRRLEDLRGFAWLEAQPRTGRMHQIRAHLATLHHPCIGDDRYAGARWKGVTTRWLRDVVRRFPRPALHARRIVVEHPRSGRRLVVEAPLPPDLVELLETLRRWRDS